LNRSTANGSTWNLNVKQKQNRSTCEKGRNGQLMAVSPFDGANRIRFKGSLFIADFRLPIAD
jgi:hypothetical protein